MAHLHFKQVQVSFQLSCSFFLTEVFHILGDPWI